MHSLKRFPSLVLGICLAAVCVPALVAQPSIGFGPNLGSSSTGPYNFPLTATGGTAPYRWSVTSGSLPAGLFIRNDVPNPLPAWWPANASAGIVGVATAAQFDPGASFTLTVTDATGLTSTLDCTLKILPLTILETSELPDAFVNATYGYTLTPGNPNGSVRWTVPQGSDPLPAGLTLDATTGAISGTPVKAGSYDFHITATDANGTTNWKRFKLNVAPVGFATSGALGNAKSGSFFSVSLAAAGGAAPYRFSGSSLPPGLTVTSDGFLSGTVAGGGNTAHRFELTVSDDSGGSYSKQFALNVAGSSPEAPGLNFRNPVSDLALGEPNSYRFSADGGVQPYSWSINGVLPPGLRLRRAHTRTGVGPLDAEIAGTPTQAGSYTFDVVLTDGGGSTTSQSVTLNVATMTVDAPPSALRGRPYSFYLRPIGGYPAYRWETVGRLPMGLVLDSATGEIHGTPLENGNFTVTVEIDALATGGKKILRSVDIPVHSPTSPRISSSAPWRLADALINVPVSYETDFCCGSASLTYSWTGASPSGMTLNPVTGQISGTPTAAGPYQFKVTATDSADSANYGVREFFLMVSPRRPGVTGRPAPEHGRSAGNPVAEPGGIRNSVALAGGATAGLPAAGGGALNFVPITPCRVLDTRNQASPFGGPAIAGNSSRDFNIPASACGIPATAQAYSVNVVVVPSGPLGFITMWPTGQTQPLASTLNSLDGRIKSNAAIVLAGTGGSISIFASNTTDAILDINGYFVPATDPTGLAFYPVAPCRIADTRNGVAALGGPSMAPAQTRTFPVLSSACNLPATARAYSLNFAVVPSGALGFLAAWPTGATPTAGVNFERPDGHGSEQCGDCTGGNKRRCRFIRYEHDRRGDRRERILRTARRRRVVFVPRGSVSREGHAGLWLNHYLVGCGGIRQRLRDTSGSAGACFQYDSSSSRRPGLLDALAPGADQTAGLDAERAGRGDHLEHGHYSDDQRVD